MRISRSIIQTRSLATAASSISPISVLPRGTIETFRAAAFTPELPALLPRRIFASYPAISKWFEDVNGSGSGLLLNTAYLEAANGSDAARVPIELTRGANADGQPTFLRTEAPLHVFLGLVAHAQEMLVSRSTPLAGEAPTKVATTPDATPPEQPQVYLAQCPIDALPPSLAADLPQPEVVAEAGRGDVYASSVWLGLAPTCTPLHRDPNPNLFVQLAGRKALRVFEPAVGAEIFREARRAAGLSAGNMSFRDEDMMQGAEKEALERFVWDDAVSAAGFEAVVGSGDAVFIPKGWWHSFRGLGEGMVGSVNWWFR